MKELEYLSKKGILISEKQYIIIWIKICLMLLFTTAICIGGFIMMTTTLNQKIFIVGLVLLFISIALYIFDIFFCMIKYAAKIQLYLHSKKHPEDFESEVNSNSN